ncbi:hypothetical protein HRI_004389100 [Hibiscus trionum]|uniref:BHLH domain-containing protein n=1 Tax=Hibiscus trionum TaxID=183268 RepID=A0A9W7J8G9_HIBTR|nr:hypothetical protein HRI_004389100 [Hibiscus trionum]
MGSSKRCPRLRRKVYVMRRRRNGTASSAESVRTDIERKLEQLQMMLPTACSEINADTLFQRTADYVFFLQAKLRFLHTLSAFYGV